MDIHACEKVWGKFYKEDENFYYFHGLGEYGVTVPKKLIWKFIKPTEMAEEKSPNDPGH